MKKPGSYLKILLFSYRKRFLKVILSLFVTSIVQATISGQGSAVRIIKADSSWKIEVNGDPFFIKGVVGFSYPEKIKEYGGNSVRMGSRKNDLDNANDLGLKALVNLPAGAERDGMNYDDTASIRNQTEKIVAIVRNLKDHPAVLIWAIGNELDFIPPTKPFNPKVWDAVNQAAKAIHSVDNNHPVMTVIGTSMMWKVADIVKRCPDLDLLGINSYGDIYTLGDTLRKYGWTKPYVITEWGPDGYWEVKKAPWGAPYEQTGLEKYNCYKNKYIDGILKNSGQCLGSYVFYWAGFKQETTHTWFCMFDKEGLESPLVGLMHFLWTGNRMQNEAPLADSMRIGQYTHYDPVVADKGTTLNAIVYVKDPDGDKLTYKWEIRPEAVYASYAGQGEKIPEPVSGLITGGGEAITFTAPSQPGPYRLFAYVYDGNGHISSVNLPFFVSPQLMDSVDSGRYISRTMNLLFKSTREKKNPVRILVYGQSISEQEWWLEVKKYLENKFPEADIDMRNLAVGGFSAQILYKTVEMDVSSFYPDLVLLHVYGDPVYYDSVLYTIRSRTAAEVAIMTDHYIGPNQWSDTMSYHLLPSLADRYSCEMINIRDSWKQYLEQTNLKPAALLSDGIHLNRYGNLVMAELVKKIFVYNPNFPADPFGLSRTYTIGADIRFNGKVLTMPFYGNRIVIKSEKEYFPKGDSLRVLVDGNPPSSYQGTYFMTRPVNPDGRKWPWSLPAMIRVRHSVPWTTETWKCTFIQAEPPYDDFSFSIFGSVTGDDGAGSSLKDFRSNSGRVIIKAGDAESGGDWHLKRSNKVLKTTVGHGDFVTWKTFSISEDFLKNPDTDIRNNDYRQVVIQGIPNSDHILKLIKTGKKTPVIKEIIIYRPLLNN